MTTLHTIKLFKHFVCSMLIMFWSTACQQKPTSQQNDEMMNSNQPTMDWIILFDGKDMNEWRGYHQDEVPSVWSVEDGAMAFTPRAGVDGNIISRKTFKNFMLSLEWKISEGGNSGIFWGVKELPGVKRPYETGPEIQVLDNLKHPDAKAGATHQAGALYDMIAPIKNVTKPAGEWNEVILTINHNTNKGSVVQNGVEILTFPVNGPDWDEMVAHSKFKDWDYFGLYPQGHIGLQDHGDKVWYRAIKIKPLAD